MFTPEDMHNLVADRPTAVKALFAVWAFTSAVTIAVYFIITAFTAHFDTPWPLFNVVPLGFITYGAWWMTTPAGRTREEVL